MSQPDDKALIDLSRSLIEGWHRDAERRTAYHFGQRKRRPNPARFGSIYALAGHTNHLVEQAITHFESGQDLLAFPLLRLAFESSLTATWMALNDESWSALQNNEIRAREALKKTIGESRQFADRLKDFPALDEKIPNVSSDAQARSFARLCEDLAPDGKTFYILYRVLSKQCHPTGFVIDRFIQVKDGGEIEALFPRPTPGADASLWLFMSAMCLVDAARAVDFIDTTHSRRSELQAAARQVGIPRELSLTAEALQRIRRTEQDRS